ncbi:tobamovirus multiplication protein 1 isoform X2 [Amborella trichopoda]|uniref:tobamovirus multiplication protein 1 isoform X2 n=1 Tax=Amborella trichopoda TaxID=13333 RepID=UPI0009C041D5|nr:tobamovirus multiplication protein 1 isoform X2 [Amborella trichopoda]|eukprot:XP_020528341.1 tobamovirus multiplication protein 1 isoform X2 [Amborella trichopoda]
MASSALPPLRYLTPFLVTVSLAPRSTMAVLLPKDERVYSAASDWWDEVQNSQKWQDGIFYALCAAYSAVAAVALIQLFRIQLRVPEYGWTTQKVFHLMNFIVNGLRAILFGFYRSVFLLKPKVLQMVLLELPGLLFFSTYTLLVLFWAEIYHQARSLRIDRLRPAYLMINGAIYLLQVCIWIYVRVSPNAVALEIAKLFFAVVSFFAALGFLLYGGRLFFMLRRFPIESKGRRKKLNEGLLHCRQQYLLHCWGNPSVNGNIG